MRYFLIVYDRHVGSVLDLREFEAESEALKERFRIEGEHMSDPAIEVVVLGAMSREALEYTHARYFKTPGQLASSA